MIMINIKALIDKDNKLEGLETKVFDTNTDEILRETQLIIGDHVLIDPLNPTKMKNRDRTGRIVGYYLNDLGNAETVKVKFDDTKRAGKIEPEELIPYII